jgi:hypothetical protein
MKLRPDSASTIGVAIARAGVLLYNLDFRHRSFGRFG